VEPVPPSEPEHAEAAPVGAPPTERGAWWAGYLLGLALLGTLAAVALIAVAALAGAPPRAVLLFGVDERPDEQERGIPGHTDMIAVLVFGPTGAATLVSFPRDLWVTIPGYGPERLNVAYPIGAQSGGPPAGAALLARTLSADFGLATDRWARVDFRGFAAAVDAAGGVDVIVPQTIVDETYPTDDYGTRRLVIPAGRQHFDGAEALAYARTRAPDSDFGRMARQQQLLLALRQQLLSPAGLVRLPGLLATLPAAVRSDLSARETLALLRTLATTPPDRLRTVVIGPDLAPPSVGPGGAAILTPRTDAIRQAIAQALRAQ
jgi:LCP family protein required for cell wall assembly